LDREDRWDKFILERLEGEKENLNNVSPLVEEFTDFLLKKGMSKVLDLGCGLGRHMRYMAGKGLSVVGCDISEETLVMAEELANKANLKLDFVRGDYMDLPFNNAAFQGVIAINTLHHDFPESIYRAFREIHRVIKPDGYLAFDPLSVGDGRFGNGRPLGDKLFVLHGIPHYFFDKEELERLLERLYFEIIIMKRIKCPVSDDSEEVQRERFHIIVKKLPNNRRLNPPVHGPLM